MVITNGQSPFNSSKVFPSENLASSEFLCKNVILGKRFNFKNNLVFHSRMGGTLLITFPSCHFN